MVGESLHRHTGITKRKEEEEEEEEEEEGVVGESLRRHTGITKRKEEEEEEEEEEGDITLMTTEGGLWRTDNSVCYSKGYRPEWLSQERCIVQIHHSGREPS